jgi:hypothetical protein
MFLDVIKEKQKLASTSLDPPTSSNIFMDVEFNRLIGEVHISKLLDTYKGNTRINVIAGAFGYIPWAL